MEENTAKKMVVELIGGVGTGKSRVGYFKRRLPGGGDPGR